MSSNNWKKVGIIFLTVFLLIQSKKIGSLIKKELYDLVIDAFDYLWFLPQGLRFALLSTFLILLIILIHNVIISRKGGDKK